MLTVGTEAEPKWLYHLSVSLIQINMHRDAKKKMIELHLDTV